MKLLLASALLLGGDKLELHGFESLPEIGRAGATAIRLGGFSGLDFAGVNDRGVLEFVTVTDRGPTTGKVDVDGDGVKERPYVLPDAAPRIVRFELAGEPPALRLTQVLPLMRSDGETPLTGLPSPGGAERAVDLMGRPRAADEFGVDLEGVVLADDGSFWTVDESRPGLCHFDPDGRLLARYVPAGSGAETRTAEAVIHPTLPASYARIKTNRGFEALAFDREAGLLYAFLQSPLENPDEQAAAESAIVRILVLDADSGTPVGEYAHVLESIHPERRKVDKLTAATLGADGRLLVLERDASSKKKALKFLFELDLSKATDLLAPGAPGVPGGRTLEQCSPAELDNFGIRVAGKRELLRLADVGYRYAAPEGLALLPDGRLALIADDDFRISEDDPVLDGTVELDLAVPAPRLALITLARVRVSPR